jgi:hypothetical protein
LNTDDLNEALAKATTIRDTATTVDQLLGPTESSVAWSNHVANTTQIRIDEEIARREEEKRRQERNRQIANCKAAILAAVAEGRGEGWDTWIESFWMNEEMTKAAAGTQGSTPALTPQHPRVVRAVREGDTWRVISIVAREDKRFPLTSIEEWELPW